MVAVVDKKHTIGQKISLLRKKKGWNQRILADKMSVTPTAISNWEGDKRKPDRANLIMLADIFNVNIDYFYDDDTKIIDNEDLSNNYSDYYIKLYQFGSFEGEEYKYLFDIKTQKPITHEIDKRKYDFLKDLYNEDIQENYFIYKMRKTISPYIKKDALILFEKIVGEYKYDKDDSLILIDSGDVISIIENKDQVEFVAIEGDVIKEMNRIIGVARYIINIPL